jgi:transcriptional regulator with XRE-family HTH domain
MAAVAHSMCACANQAIIHDDTRMTPFGEKLRLLRDERGITLKHMAEALDVSSAYLSALEHGKRGRPSWRLVQAVIAYFNIIWDDAEELVKLARVSHPRITIDTAGLSPKATELANRLSQNIGKLDDQKIASLMAILETQHRQD